MNVDPSFEDSRVLTIEPHSSTIGEPLTDRLRAVILAGLAFEESESARQSQGPFPLRIGYHPSNLPSPA
jgi:hypothetical protein